MKIRGEEFIKKVKLKSEKNEIEQRLNEINEAESIYEEPVIEQPTSIQNRLDREIEIQEEQEYSDIMLGKGSSNEQNKKKYLILGLVLVILFLLTIIIIRLLTGNSSSDDSFAKTNENQNEKVVENENIEEQYQKIINEKLNSIKEEKEKQTAIEEKIEENLNLEKIEEKEVLTKIEETKPDVFEVKEEPIYVPPKKTSIKEPVKKIVKKEKPKPKPPIKKEVKKVVKKVKAQNTITTKPKGTFIQIGAFSKIPNDKYLNNITNKGFKYTIYKVSINNKLFHKVLIGPYTSKGQARLATDNVKKKLNVSGAFILTF